MAMNNPGSITDWPTHPTPYADVNAVVGGLLSGARGAIGNHLVGMYLYGSLATGDFCPGQSDIDFVVVTADALSSRAVQRLETLHTRLAASGPTWAKLEGAYVPRDVIRRHSRQHAPCPCVNEGRFYLARLGSDWIIRRYVLRKCGLVVAGPAPERLIDTVESGDLRQAVLGFLHEWWAPMLQKPDARLCEAEYQAYAVLTMCRTAYTLDRGTIVSKSRAAQWAQDAFDEQRSGLIEWALTWRGNGPAQRMNEVLDFVRYTLDRSQVNGTVDVAA